MYNSFKFLDTPSWFEYFVIMVVFSLVMMASARFMQYLVTKLFYRINNMMMNSEYPKFFGFYHRNLKVRYFIVVNIYILFFIVWAVSICANFSSVSDAVEASMPENQAKENVVIYKKSDNSFMVYNKASDKPIRIYTEKVNENGLGHETLEYIDVKPNTNMSINNIDQTKEVHDRSDIEKNTTDFHTPDDKFDGVVIVHRISFNEKVECNCDSSSYILKEDNSWYTWNHSDKTVIFHLYGPSLRSKDYVNAPPHRHINQIDMDNEYKKEN